MVLAGYKYLRSYQLSVIIYDLTVEFIKRWVESRRTGSQMEQAARSGKQNIAEGYMEKSLKSYIYLAGVACASLSELLEDYEDFARQNKIQIWPKDKVRAVREVGGIIDDIWERSTPDHPYIPHLPHKKEHAINLMITLVNQAIYLLKRQIISLEEKFIKEGGYTENLFKRRMEERGRGGEGGRGKEDGGPTEN